MFVPFAGSFFCLKTVEWGGRRGPDLAQLR